MSSLGFHKAFLEHLGSVDIVSFSILFISMVAGLFRGFSREMGSLIVWAGALAITVRLNPFLVNSISNMIAPALKDSQFFIWGSHIFLCLIALVLLNIFARRAIQLTRDVLSGGIDHISGALFGVARGYILLIIVFIFLGWAAPNWLESLANKSLTMPYVARGAVIIKGYLPPSLSSDLAFR